MSQPREHAAGVLRNILLFTAAIALGGGLGFLLAVQMRSRDVDHEVADHEEHTAEAEEAPHVAISKSAFEALEMQVGPIARRDYVRTISIPGVVQELPGKSNLSVSAPATGVVEEVLATAGQAVQANDVLFRIRITDEKLADAQAALLDTVARLQTVEAEIKRVEPLVETGGAIGRRLIDLEYERQRLATTQAARQQELVVLGLSDDEIKGVLGRQELVTHLVVRVDRWADFAAAPPPYSAEPTVQPAAYEERGPSRVDERDFSIESLHVSPGQTVQRGAELCHLSYHRRLYIRGQAFESDLPAIEELQERHGTITAQFGHSHGGDHHYDVAREGLHILYVDNHVDPVTQTFQFYAPLDNESAHDEVRGGGAVFRTWRFKPGQRAHLLVPSEQWDDQLVVPREAVVVDGLETIMFRLREHDDHEDEEDHASHDEGFEFEPVGVRMLHQDGEFAVLGDSAELHADDEFALNNAQQLLLALKLHLGGGGGGHDHEH